MKKSEYIRMFIWLILFCQFITSGGCDKRKGAGEKTQPDTISAYGITLTEESTPEEVAGLLIRGLDNDDKDVLTRLVAIKNEMVEIKKIYQKLGQRPKDLTPEGVAIITAKGWIASYAIIEPGRTEITGERIEGERASVYCAGIDQQGKKRTFEIRLVREDGWWKVTAGLHFQ